MPRRGRRVRFDLPRLAEAVKRPGLDERTWSSPGRIDDDPEARFFDPGVGWLVDVEFHGSDLQGAESQPCRVLSQAAGDGAGEYIPPPVGTEVIVDFPGGDPELGAVVVGYATNEDGCKPPTSVNDLPIDAESETSTPLTVSPYDTEFKVSPHHRREHYALDRHIQARNQVIEATELLKLAIRDAAQSYVRGERFVQVLNGWVNAVSDYVSANGAADAKVYVAINGLAPGTVLPNEIAAVATARAQTALQKTAFQNAAVAGDALSSRIKGD